MHKILFVIYYALTGIIEQVNKGLINNGFKVDYFPLFMFSKDATTKCNDYSYLLNKRLIEGDYDSVLFWCLDIEGCELETIKRCNQNTIFMFYNCYDPHCWSVTGLNIEEKVKHFDIVFTCCKGYVDKYKNGIFLPPGFYQGVKSEHFKSDISMCILSLHSGREEIIESLENSRFTFKLYGPKTLSKFKSYQREISYEEVYDVYASSKVGITTHIIKDVSCYVNDSEMMICGNNCLLLRDDNLDSFFEGVMIDNIDEVLDNYDDYEDVRRRDFEKAQEWTWDNFGEVIKKHCGEPKVRYFDDYSINTITININPHSKLSLFRHIFRSKNIVDILELFNETNKKYASLNASDILDQYMNFLDC